MSVARLAVMHWALLGGLYHLKCLPVTAVTHGGLGRGLGGGGFRVSVGLVKEIVGRGPSLPSRPG